MNPLYLVYFGRFLLLLVAAITAMFLVGACVGIVCAGFKFGFCVLFGGCA